MKPNPELHASDLRGHSNPKRVRGVKVPNHTREALERLLSRSFSAVFGEGGELLRISLDLGKKESRALTPGFPTDSLLTLATNRTATDDG